MKKPKMQNYDVNEIFVSIDGEVNACHQGRICVFVRFQGCNMRCPYCDTVKTQTSIGGTNMSIGEVLSRITKFPTKKVTLTGGEPLLQNITPLCKTLFKLGYDVAVETNGTIPFSDPIISDPRFSFVIDAKMSSSNQKLLTPIDSVHPAPTQWDWISTVMNKSSNWLKVPIATKEDLVEAFKKINQYNIPTKQCAFSPIAGKYGKMTPKDLFNHMLECGWGDSVINIQIHKLIDMP